MGELQEIIDQLPTVVKSVLVSVLGLVSGWLGVVGANARAKKMQALASQEDTQIAKEKTKQLEIHDQEEQGKDRAKAWKEIAQEFKKEILELKILHKEEIAALKIEIAELRKTIDEERNEYLEVATKLAIAEAIIQELKEKFKELEKKQ